MSIVKKRNICRNTRSIQVLKNSTKIDETGSQYYKNVVIK